MLHHNRFNSFHDLFLHTSDCEQCLLSFFSLVENKVNVQLQKSIFKVHTIANIHGWFCYFHLRFLKDSVATIHVYVLRIVDVLLLSLVESANARGKLTLF